HPGRDRHPGGHGARPGFPAAGGFAQRPPAPPQPPPPPRRENWLGWVAFLLGIAVLSGAAGYTLNRVTSGSGTPTAGPTTGEQPASTTDPAAGGSGQGTGPTAEQVAILLANQGLPLRTTVVYTAQNDPDRLLGRPGGYSSRLAFTDERISASEIAGAPADAIERGGAIEVFVDPASAAGRGAALRAPAGGDLPKEYTYVRGTIVLRLSLILPEEMAAGYETALAAVAGQPSQPGQPS
ncbi:hypothetical protein AB1484_14625, partial [Parafrankia sp. FMc6]|uniref:hypothetical protein n=1 Tax=Parafrankia soli TaxID=2599596 RepID=UPI0034D5FBF6